MGSATKAAAQDVGTSSNAAELAEQTGHPVVVADATTETTLTTANPDGTFTLTSSLTPVRVQQDGEWKPIDTTLEHENDGTISPAAVAENVSFSGGGSGPLVTLRDGEKSVSFTWPNALPSPSIDGDTATYSEVLPGIDLQLTAQPDSYSEVLVVKNAAAATDPAIRDIHMEASVQDLDLGRSTNGGLVASDDTGKAVFQGSPPVMWDSSTNPAVGTTPSADEPGSGRVDPLAMTVPPADATGPGASVDSTTVTLVPPQAALTDSNVTYPVYIDPSISPARHHFAVVFNNGWHYYDDTSYDLKVGDCGWQPECGTIGVGRTYLSFDTGSIINRATTAVVSSAEVDVWETHNAGGCTVEPTTLYSSNAFDSSVQFPGPISGYLETQSSKRGDSCGESGTGPGDVVYNTSAVANFLQSVANNDWGTVYFALKALDETDRNQWKRFSDDGASSPTTAATLKVTYNFPPSPPTGLGVTGAVNCNGGTFTADQTPSLFASDVDNNSPALNLNLWFHVFAANNHTWPGVRHNAHFDPDIPSGGTGTTDLGNPATSGDTTPLSDGSYDFNVYSTNDPTDAVNPPPSAGSAISAYKSFTIDHVQPVSPTIASFDYPSGAWGRPDNSPGTIDLLGGPDTVGFQYSFTGSFPSLVCQYSHGTYDTGPATTVGGVIPAVASGGGTKAIITLPTNLGSNVHTLSVRAFDNARNLSASASYPFYVAPGFANEKTTTLEAEDQAFSGASTYNEPSSADSNGADTRFVGTAPGSSFCTTFTQAIDEADFAVGLQYETGTHYGQYEVSFDGGAPLYLNNQVATIDGYSQAPGPAYATLGGIHLKSTDTTGNPVSHSICFTAIGKNPSSTDYVYNGTYGGVPYSNVHDNGYSFAIDYIRIVPVAHNATTSLAAARNNTAVANATTQANFGPSASNRGLSQADLISLGLLPTTPGGSAAGLTTPDGATFKMISPTASDGSDNAIVDGQTINLDTATTAHTVNLLVTSTCGTLTANTSTEVTLNYTAALSTSSGIPTLPDWLLAAAADTSGVPGIANRHAAATLHTYTSTTQNSTYATLYELTIPVPTNRQTIPIASITMPNPGFDTTDNCGGQAPNMHVLAMTTT